MTTKSHDLMMMLLLGVAGGAIGFGIYGTLQAAVMGFGIGLVALPAIVIILP